MSYGGHDVLANVRLEITPGDTIALVGPSGSGKTSILSVIGLLQEPSNGSVEVFGAQAPSSQHDRARFRARHVSWVFQTPNMLRRRSATDNVVVPLLAMGHHRSQAEPKAREVLDRVGLARHWNTAVHLLSGGELQRVSVARAVVNSPTFLCADEPTGNLDRATSKAVMDAILDARDSDTALLVATHDRDVANRCARIIEVREGTLHER